MKTKILIIIFLTASSAIIRAQELIITNIDSTIYINDTISLDINQDNQNDYALFLHMGSISGWSLILCLDTIQTVSAWEFNPGDDYPFKYSVNDTIDSSLDYYYGYFHPTLGIFPMVLGTLDYTTGASGNFWAYDTIANTFVDIYDAFIGLRLTIGSDYHYGWIMIDKGVENDWLTVRTIAYNPNPNMPVICGLATSQINQNLLISHNYCNIYPNPTNGKIQIDTEEISGLEVLDSHGSKIFSGIKQEIDLTELPNGIYFIKVITNKKTFCRRIIKQ